MTAQLDLFAPPTAEAIADSWDRHVVRNKDKLWAINRSTPSGWGERPHGAVCGECAYFVQSKARPGMDGYCSFHAFASYGDPRGDGWQFGTFGQACTVTP